MLRSVLTTACDVGIRPVASCASRTHGESVRVTQREDLLEPNAAAPADGRVG